MTVMETTRTIVRHLRDCAGAARRTGGRRDAHEASGIHRIVWAH
jgi:hypothetical protein